MPNTDHGALRYIDGEPYYDLSAEFVPQVFSIRIDPKREIHTKWRRYAPTEAIRYLNERQSKLVPSKVEEGRDLVDESGSAARDFFDSVHLESRFNGKLVSDEQLEKLDIRFDFKADAIENGLDGLLLPDDEEDEISPDDPEDLDELLTSANRMDLVYPLADDEFREIRVPISFTFSDLNAKQKLAWDGCRKVRLLKKGARRMVFNHARVWKLFLSSIKSVRAVIGDTPCNADNREEWIEKVPLLMAVAVMLQRFKGVERGNA